MKYNSRYPLLTITVIIIGVLFVWILKSYYYNDVQREAVYDKVGNLLELRQVLMVFRHGKRSPVTFMSYDQYKDPKYFPDGLGQLTKEGKSQLYEMGKTIRSRYYNLITPYSMYILNDVKTVTTKVDRCFQSAALLLAGLYPPKGHQIWNQKLRWQPVPISSESPDKVYVFTAGPSSCPSLFKALDFVNATHDDESVRLINYLSKYVNFSDNPRKKLSELFLTCDTIVTEVKLNLPQPHWIKDIYPEQVINFLKRGLSVIADNRFKQRLVSGRLITDIVSQMETVVKKNNYTKIYLYSGHDTSVTCLMHSLGFSTPFTPDYGASVIFELYVTPSDEYFVKVLYNKNVSFLEIETLILPQCEELCPFDKFVTILAPLFITEIEWTKECNLT